jgi:hypothetical protein
VALVLVQGADREDQVQGSAAASAVVAYDDLLTLSVEERRVVFNDMSDENRAMIVRTHAERWLEWNRGRLWASEVAVFQEVLVLITPQLVGRQPNDGIEETLRATVRCRLSPNDVMEALSASYVLGDLPVSRSSESVWNYWTRARCWLEWAAEGVRDYLPGLQH